MCECLCGMWFCRRTDSIWLEMLFIWLYYCCWDTWVIRNYISIMYTNHIQSNMSSRNTDEMTPCNHETFSPCGGGGGVISQIFYPQYPICQICYPQYPISQMCVVRRTNCLWRYLVTEPSWSPVVSHKTTVAPTPFPKSDAASLIFS